MRRDAVGPRVVVSTAYFVPGYRGGGPIRSVDALTRAVPDRRFSVWTRDRDLGDAEAYRGAAGAWVEADGRSVYHVDTGRVRSYLDALRALRRLGPDVYYFNSLWSPLFSLVPLLLLRVGVLPRAAVVIAPRGELARAALRLSGRRKRAIGALLRAVVLPGMPVRWHATADSEAEDIRRWAGPAEVSVVPNLVPGPEPDALPAPEWVPPRAGDPLRVLFLSRLAPKKNLDGALLALARVTRPVELRIVGPPEDAAYERRCRALAARLPATARVTFVGPVNHRGTAAQLAWADVFFFPTRNENFGHVVREALCDGCPVLASTETPWSAVLARAGLPPRDCDDHTGFAADLDALAAAGPARLASLRQRAREGYADWLVGQRWTVAAMADLLRPRPASGGVTPSVDPADAPRR